MNPLLSKFFLGRDELLEQIKTFEKKRQLNLLRHLASKENEEEFLSVISEIQFGLFFDKKASTVYYEKRIDNKKPDWTFTMNGQEVIAEVVRLNPSAKDKADLDFIDGFMESIHEIEIGCIINVDFKWGAIEKDRIDFSACKNFIKDWISISRAIHDKIVLFEVIEVEFVVFDHTLGHACLSVGGSPIDRDLRRLSSEKSTLSVKGVKYNEIIEKRNIPYIICIYIDFHAWFNKRELYRALYGFPHNKANALFYSSNQIMKNASGILLKQQDEYTYFHNFSNKRLNEDNIKFFSMWQYSMNED